MKIGIQTWGSEGDIRPFVALAKGLAGRGHSVSLVITSVDRKDYRPFSGPSLEIVQTPGPVYERQELEGLMARMFRTRDLFMQLRIVIGRLFNPLLDEMLAQSKMLSEANDILVGHFLLHPLKTAADKTGKTYVTVTLNHLGVPTRHRPPLGLPSPGGWFNPCLWALGEVGTNIYLRRDINRIRAREGLKPVRSVLDEVFFSKDANLLPISRVFCPPMEDWSGRHFVCGFFNVEDQDEKWQMPPDLRAFLAAGPPPVYVTLGSMISVDPEPETITKVLVDAVLKSGTRAIVQSKWEAVNGIPEHPDIYRIRTASHQAVFPSCALVVHHGGAGTTHSAMRCGCPSVVVKHLLDQGFWGKELQRLSIAPPVIDRRDLTSKKLARAIRSVLDSPDMKTRAEELGQTMQEEQGVQTAVDIIERLKPDART